VEAINCADFMKDWDTVQRFRAASDKPEGVATRVTNPVDRGSTYRRCDAFRRAGVFSTNERKRRGARTKRRRSTRRRLLRSLPW